MKAECDLPVLLGETKATWRANTNPQMCLASSQHLCFELSLAVLCDRGPHYFTICLNTAISSQGHRRAMTSLISMDLVIYAFLHKTRFLELLHFKKGKKKQGRDSKRQNTKPRLSIGLSNLDVLRDVKITKVMGTWAIFIPRTWFFLGENEGLAGIAIGYFLFIYPSTQAPEL